MQFKAYRIKNWLDAQKRKRRPEKDTWKPVFIWKPRIVEDKWVVFETIEWSLAPQGRYDYGRAATIYRLRMKDPKLPRGKFKLPSFKRKKKEVATVDPTPMVVGKAAECFKCFRIHPPGPCENFTNYPRW